MVIKNMDEQFLECKREPITIEIKKEDIASDNSEEESENITDFPLSTADIGNNNYDTNIWQTKSKLEYTEPINKYDKNIKAEDDSSDDLSDHFIETFEASIKREKLEKYDPQKYTDNINTAFLNREYKNAYFKEEIEVEEHNIKLEINENTSGSELKPEHNDLKNPKAVYKCNSCKYETSNQSSFKKHSSLHEDPSKVVLYFCTKCNYRTRQKCHLKRHDLVHQKTDELIFFHCDICGFKTKQKCTLKRHIHSLHMSQTRTGNVQRNIPNDNELHTCSECSYTTYKKGLLISHLDKHKDTRDANNLFICDICSFSTKYRRNLRIHLEIHKESPELQIHECKLCSFKTRIGYCLKRHLLSRKHLLAAGKIKEYCPRPQKL